MQIKYRIIEVHPDEQQIVVRFYTAAMPEESLASQVDGEGKVLRCRTDVAISLPLPTPTGADLDALIMRACPAQFFRTKEAVADPATDTSLAAILPLVNVETVATLPAAGSVSQAVSGLISVRVV